MTQSTPEKEPQQAKDTNWQPYPIKEPLSEQEVSQASLYLEMRDGIRIAVTYYLPKDMSDGAQMPTILRTTRYWRAIDGVPPDEHVRQYLANGYASVSVDARGTGASFGVWNGAWSPEETKDYDEVVNWIIKQPWSNGVIGTVGISYEGTSAEMVVTNCNPAVKAAIPQFSFFDSLAEIAYPGGILLARFLEAWANLDATLDRNEPRTIPLGKNKKLLAGVLPVDEDVDGSILEKAVRERIYNFDPYQDVIPMQFRDDFWGSDPSRTARDYTPYGYVEQLRRSGTPIYGYSGYGDGSNALAVIHRFLTIRNPGSKIVLGPWSHVGNYHISPYVQSESAFNHIQEEIRFFDRYLKGIDNGIDEEAPVHYFTMVEEKWHTAESFPPNTDDYRLYFQPENRLGTQIPADVEGWDDYQVDYSTGTGEQSRWNTILGGGIVNYPNRKEADQKLRCYDSPSLERDLIVTGMPTVTLYISSSATDGDFFAYLEDVDEDGNVYHVTEGELRALHRKLSTETPPYVHAVPYHSFERKDAAPLVPGQITELVFHLLPVSFLFRKGHQIRLALAGADADHFRRPNVEPPLVRYYRQADYATFVNLPVEMRKPE
jgi:putative CocE/NonD family hydrolase